MGFAGSMAGMQLFRMPLSAVEADCLYRNGEFTVGSCKPIELMSGLHYFQSFMPGVRDLSGATARAPGRVGAQSRDGNTLAGLGTVAAPEVCAQFCAEQGYQYSALQWANECFCDNQYGGAGRVSDDQCDFDQDGLPDCGTGTVSFEEGVDMFEQIRARFPNGDMPCSWRNAVYYAAPTMSSGGFITGATATYMGCYRDNGGQPEGLTLFGDAFLDDSGSLLQSGGNGAGGMNMIGATMGDELASHDDFGVHFDGDGDFATLQNSREAGYAHDSSFTVSLWMTRPDCRLPGREEWIYSHTQDGSSRIIDGDPNAPPNSDIAIAYGCSENGEHSTLESGGGVGSLHLLRVYMTDIDNQQFIFDFPLSDADSGGYVTAEWVFIALAVNGTSITPFVDGKRISPADIGYPRDRAMTGDYFLLSGDRSDETAAAYTATLQDALSACSAHCSGLGFAFMALEWMDECFCGDGNYGDYGIGDPADCTDDAGTVMCGQGYDNNPDNKCSWRIAVYSTRNAVRGGGYQYQGCYIDGGVTRGGWSNEVNSCTDSHRTTLSFYLLSCTMKIGVGQQRGLPGHIVRDGRLVRNGRRLGLPGPEFAGWRCAARNC